MKKVAIIVPVYNAQKYIDRCIQSICNQTWEEWEAWFVDDCSQDESYYICKSWQEKDNRIHVIKNSINSGAGKTRNVALDIIAARDDIGFLIFVDSDDYIHTKYIETMITLQNIHKADIVWVDVKGVSDNSKLEFDEIDENNDAQIMTGKQLLMREEDRIMYSMVWGKLFKASLWQINRMVENLRWYEDGASTYRVIYEADVIAKSPLKLYYYCHSENSSVRSKHNEERYRCALETHFVKMDFYKEKSEKELLEMTYIAYLNDLLNIMMTCKCIDTGKALYKEMKNEYRSIYILGVKCRYISWSQRFKYLVYRFFPIIRSIYISIKLMFFKNK